MARWRSSSLVFAAIGAAGVAGLLRANEQPSPEPPYEDYLHNVYATVDECRRDYAPGACGTENLDGKTHVIGPWYLADRRKAAPADPGPGVAARSGATPLAITTHGKKRRGGFGATGSETSPCS